MPSIPTSGALRAVLASGVLLLGAQGLGTHVLGVRAAVAAETVTIVTTGKGAAVQWPAFIAGAKGFFAENGIVIDFVAAPSAAAATQQVTAGSGEIAVGGMTDPLRAIDRGAKLALLRIETEIPPYTLYAKPGIKSIKELRGKIVMVGGSKDITLIYFERMAQANGLKPGDYDLLFAGTTPARFAALVSGAVDASILYPPATFKAASSGLSNIGELSDYVKDLPFTGYAANAAWAAKNKPAIIGFLKAFRKSVDWFYDKANRTEAVDILVKESGSERDDVEKTYDYYSNIHIFPRDGDVDNASIGSLVKALAATGDLEGAADPQRFIDPEITKLAAAAK